MAGKECGDCESIEFMLNELRKEVDDLYKTIYKGNGSPALTTRVTNLEGKLKGLRERLDEKTQHIIESHQTKFDAINDKIESKFSRLEGWMDGQINPLRNDIVENNELIKELRAQTISTTRGSTAVKAAIITGVAGILSTVLYLIIK